MDFFPSESKSPEASVSHPAGAAPAAVRGDSKPAEVRPQRPNTTDVSDLNRDVAHLNLNVAQAREEVQSLGVALGQLRTMAGELDERHRTLLKTYSAADQQSQDIERTFARIDSLAQMRLTELGSASDLATRTEKMLARVESFSVETDRQLAAITAARNLLSRDLTQARAETQTRPDAPGVPTTSVYRFPRPVRPGATIAAIDRAVAAVHKTTARASRRAIAAAALVVLAVVGIVATWPDGNANGVGVPVIESRVVKGPGHQPAELPQRLIPTVPEWFTSTAPAVPQPLVEARSSSPKLANPARAPAAGFIGHLAIQSSPSGAAVFVDGTPVGETPISSVQIPAGSHAIWIELPKYRRWTTAVHVQAGTQTRINATLQLAPNLSSDRKQ
jgi:hypothetical protein